MPERELEHLGKGPRVGRSAPANRLQPPSPSSGEALTNDRVGGSAPSETPAPGPVSRRRAVGTIRPSRVVHPVSEHGALLGGSQRGVSECYRVSVTLGLTPLTQGRRVDACEARAASFRFTR
jgi:hypothetical protein